MIRMDEEHAAGTVGIPYRSWALAKATAARLLDADPTSPEWKREVALLRMSAFGHWPVDAGEAAADGALRQIVDLLRRGEVEA